MERIAPMIHFDYQLTVRGHGVRQDVPPKMRASTMGCSWTTTRTRVPNLLMHPMDFETVPSRSHRRRQGHLLSTLARFLTVVTAAALDFLRGLAADEPLQPVDVSALLESLQADMEEAGVSLEETPEYLRIRVADEGPGIPEAELEQVFEPFHRLEGSRSRDTGGVGLGLSVARDIARAHGGDLVLQNRAGGGLEAILSLPRRAD